MDLFVLGDPDAGVRYGRVSERVEERRECCSLRAFVCL